MLLAGEPSAWTRTQQQHATPPCAHRARDSAISGHARQLTRPSQPARLTSRPVGARSARPRSLDWTHQSQHEHRAHGAELPRPGSICNCISPGPIAHGDMARPPLDTMLVTGQISAHFNTIARAALPTKEKEWNPHNMQGTRLPWASAPAGCWARPSSDLLAPPPCSRLVHGPNRLANGGLRSSRYDAGRAVRA